jgi:preprotein translocase subunit Sss1
MRVFCLKTSSVNSDG